LPEKSLQTGLPSQLSMLSPFSSFDPGNFCAQAIRATFEFRHGRPDEIVRRGQCECLRQFGRPRKFWRPANAKLIRVSFPCPTSRSIILDAPPIHDFHLRTMRALDAFRYLNIIRAFQPFRLADDFQARCQATKPRRFAPRHQTLRSLAGRHQSRQPAAGATQAVTPAADLPSSCHFASEKAKLVETTPSGFHGFFARRSLCAALAAGSDVVGGAITKRCMARTYYITAPPAVAGSHIRYTAHEVRCIVALFSLRLQSRGLRRWLRLRWWLLVSSEHVIRHVRTCTYRQYFASQRRQRP
jgi:hypothetical protein